MSQLCHPERREGSPSTFHKNTQSQTKHQPLLFPLLIFCFGEIKQGIPQAPLRFVRDDVIKKRSILDDVVKKCHPERREGSPSTIHQNTQSQTKQCSLFVIPSSTGNPGLLTKKLWFKLDPQSSWGWQTKHPQNGI